MKQMTVIFESQRSNMEWIIIMLVGTKNSKILQKILQKILNH